MLVTLILTILVALAVALLAGWLIIPLLRKLKLGQNVRNDGPQTHLKKAGTPSMGGVIFLIAATAATFIFCKDDYTFPIFMTATALAFALVGFLDDYLKVKRHNSKGLRAYQKIIAQVGLSLVVALFAYNNPNIGSELYVPFANVMWDLGIWYIPFTTFVMVAMVNAVNLTDGLDGLAGGVGGINSATFGIVFFSLSVAATANGRTLEALNYENIMIFAFALTGGLLGFLRYNTYPARVFMGDTGSLSLGAAITIMGVVSKLQLLLPIIGIMFVVSAVSVILQVGSFKLRHGKRIFRMAPLHHHFEMKGVHETKIVAVYELITLAACLAVALFLAFI